MDTKTGKSDAWKEIAATKGKEKTLHCIFQEVLKLFSSKNHSTLGLAV